MVKAGDIYSLSDFQRKTREHVDRLKKSGRPEVLTVHGRAELVVQDAESYQALLDALERAEALAGVRAGLDSVDRGGGA
ncbi:MAG: type II toxin-antitoxin system Phd/YefM family antitoxin [Longimicrobiales bacterium]|nr:type II toxin-antitoxin system Phd/YefM family antitoxin [Longimicrobiales bacterium]